MREILNCIVTCLIIIVVGLMCKGTIEAHGNSQTLTHDSPMVLDEVVELPEPQKVAPPEVPEVRLISFEDEFAVDPIIKNLTEYEQTELRLIAEAEDLIDGTEGMLWVMLTVINRIRANGGTVHGTIYAANQYYTAGMASHPSAASEEALRLLMCGTDPSDGAKYFRTETYHSFGVPVAHIGHHFYSK